MPELRKPYLLYLGESTHPTDAKTACGLRDWCPDDVMGEWSLPQATVSVGLPRLSPAEAAARGAGSLVVGIAPVGGRVPDSWLPDLEAAIASGLDIVSGMHMRLTSFPSLVAAAQQHGVRLMDVRHSDTTFPAGTGDKRTGMRVATVGTDCALGKKYTALALTNALRARGAKATFRATGQTGILIAGSGVPIDALVADFISGGAEWVSPAREDGGWDLIEGQGSLFHPSFAGVSLGLLHGSQPDVIVMCHEAGRQQMRGLPHYSVPSLKDCIEANLTAARLTNAKVSIAGVALNTSLMPVEAGIELCGQIERELGLPCQDPVTMGTSKIVDRMLECVAK